MTQGRQKGLSIAEFGQARLRISRGGSMASSRASRRKPNRKLALETLESRCLLSGNGLTAPLLPFGVAHGPAMVSAADPLDALRNSLHATIKGVGSGRYTPPDDFGNTTSTAHALTLSNTTYTASVSGKINYQGDVDFFSVVANRTGVMTVTVSAAATGG